MAVGFPTGSFRSIASQTPMSFCAAINASTCTRTSKGMSSIAPVVLVVSTGPLTWLKNAHDGGVLGSTDGVRPGVPPGRRPEGERHPKRDGYVNGDGQGQLGPPRNLAAGPGVLTPVSRAPSPSGGEKLQRDRKRQARATPRHAFNGLQPTFDPRAAILPQAKQGVAHAGGKGGDAPTCTHSEELHTCCDVDLGVQRKGTSAHARDPRKATQAPVPSQEGACTARSGAHLRRRVAMACTPRCGTESGRKSR